MISESVDQLELSGQSGFMWRVLFFEQAARATIDLVSRLQYDADIASNRIGNFPLGYTNTIQRTA